MPKFQNNCGKFNIYLEHLINIINMDDKSIKIISQIIRSIECFEMIPTLCEILALPVMFKGAVPFGMRFNTIVERTCK